MFVKVLTYCSGSGGCGGDSVKISDGHNPMIKTVIETFS